MTCPMFQGASVQAVSDSVDRESRFCFTLKHWRLWQSEAVSSPESWPCGEVLPSNGGHADVGFLPMMQSRRLSPLARAACSVAWHCRQADGNDLPTVFYSAHGESKNYYEMLTGMAAGEGVSPSQFSLSVHNAIGGLSSLHSTNTMPYVSLAAGTEGLFGAFIEAAGLLLEVQRVLVVCYEQPLPDAYQAYLPTARNTWALAMVLAGGGEPGFHLRLTRESPGDTTPAADSDSNLIDAILSNRRAGHCRFERSQWRWSVDNA
jgi:hypothetical protein